MSDNNGWIWIVGGGQIYLVSRAAFSDSKERILYFRRQCADVKRLVFLFYGNIRAAKENRSKRFRKFNPGKSITGNGNRNRFACPLDYPGVKRGGKDEQ